MQDFIDKVKNNPDIRESLETLYGTVNGVHSHWISGADKDHLNMAIKELENEGVVLGTNLEFKEINEFTKQFKEQTPTPFYNHKELKLKIYFHFH